MLCVVYDEIIYCMEDDGWFGCFLKIFDVVVISMLVVFSVVGIYGNGIVIFVYIKKKDKLILFVFILVFVVYDFLIFFVIMFYIVIMIYFRFMILYDFLCKIYMFFIIFSVFFFVFFMVVIVVDCYFCICYLFLYLMIKNWVRVVIGILLVFVGLLGVLSCLVYFVYQYRDFFLKEDNCIILIDSLISNVILLMIVYLFKFVVLLLKYNGQCDYLGIIVIMEYLMIWQKIYFLFYLIFLIIVLILYVIIYYFVIRWCFKRRK